MVKSVLIADDNAFVRQRLGELFRRESDFEVCAENGRQAIERTCESKPPLIVLDLLMPVMNGVDVARALKRLMPEVSIVMFNAYADSFTEKEARSQAYPVWFRNFHDISVLVGIGRNLVYPAPLHNLFAA